MQALQEKLPVVQVFFFFRNLVILKNKLLIIILDSCPSEVFLIFHRTMFNFFKNFLKFGEISRFPCCGKLYPCDSCHDEAEKDHEMKLANRMVCGFCSKEQVLLSTFDNRLLLSPRHLSCPWKSGCLLVYEVKISRCTLLLSSREVEISWCTLMLSSRIAVLLTSGRVTELPPQKITFHKEPLSTFCS